MYLSFVLTNLILSTYDYNNKKKKKKKELLLIDFC